MLLSTQAFLLQSAALFYTFLLLGRERALELYVLPLAYGMRRSGYLLGLMLAPALMLGILTLTLLLIDMAMLWGVEGAVKAAVLWQVTLYGMAALFVSALMIALAQYVSMTNAMIYTVVIFMLGNALDELLIFSQEGSLSSVGKTIVTQCYYFLPNFSLFDHQEAVVNKAAVDGLSFIAAPIGYLILWWTILYALAWLRFVTRVLRGER